MMDGNGVEAENGERAMFNPAPTPDAKARSFARRLRSALPPSGRGAGLFQRNGGA